MPNRTDFAHIQTPPSRKPPIRFSQSLGPPDPGPPKSCERSPKSPKSSQNWGLRGVWPPFPEIGRNRPFSPFFCLFRPFPEGAKSTWQIQKTEEKGLFPQISSDFLKPPSLKPPFAALQSKSTIAKMCFLVASCGSRTKVCQLVLAP